MLLITQKYIRDKEHAMPHLIMVFVKFVRSQKLKNIYIYFLKHSHHSFINVYQCLKMVKI